MTKKAKETPGEKEARLKREAYEEQERLIEEKRQAPAQPPSGVIRWVYRFKINDTVYCMNEDGGTIPVYSGKYADQGHRILQDAPAKAEFYVSFSGVMDFVPQTREQWAKDLEE